MTHDDISIPEGTEYLRLIFGLEANVERETEEFLPRGGERVPMTWERLGTGLSNLDRLSSCWWGCSGGDHAVEYLVARVNGSVRASLRLLRAGLYDEALNALRTAGEIVNLLHLFQLDADLLKAWRSAEARDRYGMARPTKVIQMLARQGAIVPLDATRYDLMSRIAHGNTTDAPQAYNRRRLPLTSGHFQEAGFLVGINEAALVTALTMLPAVTLVSLERTRRLTLLKEGRKLAEAVGAVNLGNVGQALEGTWGAKAPGSPGEATASES